MSDDHVLKSAQTIVPIDHPNRCCVAGLFRLEGLRRFASRAFS